MKYLLILTLILSIQAPSKARALSPKNCANTLLRVFQTYKPENELDLMMEESRKPILISHPKPRVPERPALVDEREVELLLEAALPQDREAIKFLINEIRASHIGFVDFRAALKEGALSFVHLNKQIVVNRKFVSFSWFQDPSRAKSNMWTLELLMEEAESLGLPPELETFRSPKLMATKMRENDIKDVLVTDDTSLSGRQLESILTEIGRHVGRGTRVHLIIPFITSQSLAKIDNYRRKLDIRIYARHQISSFASRVEEAVKSGILSRDGAFRLSQLFFWEDGRTIAYFDHSIPDFLSSVINRNDSRGRPVIDDIVIPTEHGLRRFQIVKPVQKPYASD